MRDADHTTESNLDTHDWRISRRTVREWDVLIPLAEMPEVVLELFEAAGIPVAVNEAGDAVGHLRATITHRKA